MNYEKFRLSSLVGLPLADLSGITIGRITALDIEGGELWATIDDDHQVRICQLSEIMCLTDGAHYCRAAVL